MENSCIIQFFDAIRFRRRRRKEMIEKICYNLDALTILVILLMGISLLIGWLAGLLSKQIIESTRNLQDE
jgi:hypothetical protein